MGSGLESALDKAETELPRSRKIKRHLLDGIVAGTFGFAVMFPYEALKMGVQKALLNRAGMFGTNLAGSGRGFGAWREGWVRNFDLPANLGGIRRYAHETAMNLTYWLPVYYTVQLGVSVLPNVTFDPNQVANNLLYGTLITLIDSWPYGWYRDSVFGWFGEPAALKGKGEGRHTKAAQFLTVNIGDVLPILLGKKTLAQAHSYA